MTPTVARNRTLICIAAAAMALACAAGCSMMPLSRLWADTATPDGSMSLQKHQRAYDGEPVTFELECQPGGVNFVVFGIKGEETVVDTGKVEGRYRWMHIFHAGTQLQDYEVYATPYLIRGRCDWVYDKKDGKWYYYPGASEKPDVQTAREQVMKITCYRVQVSLPFAARGGPPKRLELSLTRADGGRKEIPRMPAAVKDGAGYLLLLGPDAKGACEVVYAPSYDEVSRAGATRVELVVEHADGSLERIARDIETP